MFLSTGGGGCHIQATKTVVIAEVQVLVLGMLVLTRISFSSLDRTSPPEEYDSLLPHYQFTTNPSH